MTEPDLRYQPFAGWLRQRYGSPLHKVSVDAGLSCPNLDGTLASGGCTFCNNASFRPAAARASRTLAAQLEDGMAFARRRYGASRFVAYFQNFTNTHAAVAHLDRLYREALAVPGIEGLVIGTRADCVDDERLDLLAGLSRSAVVMLEYGLQSIHDDTQRRMNRLDSAAAYYAAVEGARRRGLVVGVHAILGFPWESRAMMLETADACSIPGVDYVKIHHLQVIRGTAMARQYEVETFWTWEYSEYLDCLVDFVERLSPQVAIARLFSLSPPRLVLAPRWNRSRGDVQRDFEAALRARGTCQGRTATVGV